MGDCVLCQQQNADVGNICYGEAIRSSDMAKRARREPRRELRYARFGAAVKQLRQSILWGGKPMTEHRAAELSGLSRNVINGLERGETFPTPMHVEGLATAYRVPFQALWARAWADFNEDERRLCSVGPPATTSTDNRESGLSLTPHPLYPAGDHAEQGLATGSSRVVGDQNPIVVGDARTEVHSLPQRRTAPAIRGILTTVRDIHRLQDRLLARASKELGLLAVLADRISGFASDIAREQAASVGRAGPARDSTSRSSVKRTARGA
jgi:transcriptional regulator with XRE-family HTH domain